MTIPIFHIMNLSLSLIYLIPLFLQAEAFKDDFSAGIDTSFWTIRRDDTLYTINDTNGEISFARKAGGVQDFKAVLLKFRPAVHGDFDAEVEFRKAYIDRINGTPGNQVQLNTHFGGQTFSVVRSDEYGFGHNYHVWIDPPAQWRNHKPDTSTSGTLRITRSGLTVTGYFNADTVFSGLYNNATLNHLSFCLQNNKTTDSISVIFDNFVLTADSIAYLPTGIKERQVLARTGELYQNYPNPFNSVTGFSWQLAVSSDVMVSIYNLRGQRVVTLFSGRQPAGRHQLQWNASGLPSGVYYYRLDTTAGFTQTKKLVLIK